MKDRTCRVGVVGFGSVGSYLFEQIQAHPEWGLEIAFVWNRQPDRLDSVPSAMRMDELDAFADRFPDLIVEVAHPSITAAYGESFLLECDYMPLSVSALSDFALEKRLLQAASQAGTRLLIPHGAALGLDSLSECRDIWEEVVVTMKKNPRNLDFTSFPGPRPDTIVSETLLYDGPTREICSLFPRNVNSHAAVALAGIGLDRTRSVLIADPALNVSVIRIGARGGGVSLDLERCNPLNGVSGVLTLRSILGSVCRSMAPGLHFQVC